MSSRPDKTLALRAAAEADRPALMRYLNAEPEVNLFIIGDILAHGVKSPDLDLYIQSSGGAIEGVLMRYRRSLIPYFNDADAAPSNPEPLAEKMNEFLASPGEWALLGKQEVVRAVEQRLRRKPDRARDQFLCVCRQLRIDESEKPQAAAERATGADAPRINALLAKIEEFRGPQPTDEELRGDIERGERKVALMRGPQDGRIVSVASAVAETDRAAMVIAVATDAAFRRRGYASACVVRLVQDLNARGKSACLFYDNPAAGRIYQRLGFETIARWRLTFFGR